MKIIFLDVDGVLNCTHTFKHRHNAWKATGTAVRGDEFTWPLGHLDESLVMNLNPICEQTGCNIVLSSSWRIISELPHFRGWLVGKGFKYPDTIIDRTPSLSLRGVEIQTWLDKNKDRQVTAYAILDDDGFDIIGAHPNNLIHTNRNEGLTDAKVQAVIDLLNK